MPRNYIKKGAYKTHDAKIMEDAVESIVSGSLTYSQANVRYGIAKSTLRDHVKGRIEPGARIGRPPALPEKLENAIAEKVTKAASMGFGISRLQLMNKTGKVIRNLKLHTPFRNGVPGSDWWDGFKKRHPELSLRKPEKLSQSRVRMMNRDVVSTYFQLLKHTMQELNLLDKPQYIWNMDETGIMMEHTPQAVVARKGCKSVPARTSNSRESVTTVVTVNALGEQIPPMIVVRGKTSKSLNAWAVEDGPTGAMWTYQSRAWMEDVLGEEWFSKVFLPGIGPHRPQLLILDSHSSHETLGLLDRAREENITILAYPPHTTHYLQPLDRSVFRSLKHNYNTVCSEYMLAHPNQTIRKSNWPGLFKSAYVRSVTQSNITQGFRSCGIFPFSPEAIPDEAFRPSDTYKPSDTPSSALIGSPIVTKDTAAIVPQAHPDSPTLPTSSPNLPDLTPLASPFEFSASIDGSGPIDFTATPLFDIGTLDVETCNSSTIPPGAVVVAAGPEDSDVQSLLNLLADGGCTDATLGPVQDWDANTSAEFLPEICKIQSDKPPNPRLITSCRLLTSDEIINKKKEEEVAKLKKQENVEKRKEIKKKKAEMNSSTKTKKSPIKCANCKKRNSDKPKSGAGKKTGDKESWVQCDNCQQWTHFNCLPVSTVIKPDLPFFCMWCKRS